MSKLWLNGFIGSVDVPGSVLDLKGLVDLALALEKNGFYRKLQVCVDERSFDSGADYAIHILGECLETEEEYKTRASQEAENEKLQVEAERETYNRLKAKFGDK